MNKIKRYAALWAVAMLLGGCGTLPTVSALDALLPVAAEALTLATRKAFDAEPDMEDAVCVHLPELGEDSGYVYVVCRARGVWPED